MQFELTKEEKNAINTLERLSKRWPKTLWIFAGDGFLNIMRYKENGEQSRDEFGSTDPEYHIASIKIDSDGGAW